MYQTFSPAQARTLIEYACDADRAALLVDVAATEGTVRSAMTIGEASILHALADFEPETFTCECGEHTYPLHRVDEDESTWCECGMRLDYQRDRITYAF